MRYHVLKAVTPSDTRYKKFGSDEEFHAAWGGVVSTHETELEAVTAVRWMFPDSVGFPAPVSIADKEVAVMALIERNQKIDPAGEIPFVVIVHAEAENGMEQYQIRKRKHFDAKIWRLQPVKPVNGQAYGVELRSNQIELPLRMTAIVGRERGRLVLYVEDGGVINSFTFDDPNLHIGPTKPDAITSEASGIVLPNVTPKSEPEPEPEPTDAA